MNPQLCKSEPLLSRLFSFRTDRRRAARLRPFSNSRGLNSVAKRYLMISQARPVTGSTLSVGFTVGTKPPVPGSSSLATECGDSRISGFSGRGPLGGARQPKSPDEGSEHSDPPEKNGIFAPQYREKLEMHFLAVPVRLL